MILIENGKVNEAQIYINMDDCSLTERQQWLKYEYIEKQKNLKRLIHCRNQIDKQIIDLEKEIL